MPEKIAKKMVLKWPIPKTEQGGDDVVVGVPVHR